jgi:hypothetical protein
MGLVLAMRLLPLLPGLLGLDGSTDSHCRCSSRLLLLLLLLWRVDRRQLPLTPRTHGNCR